MQTLSRYALTKLQGEEAVKKAGGRHLIARTGFEGWSLTDGAKLSFFEWLVRKFRLGKPFQVFEDRIFTPFSIYNFAAILEEMIAERIEGLYNVEGPEAVSYLEFAVRAAAVFGFDTALIQPAPMGAVLNDRGIRPRDTVLDSAKIQSILKTKFLGVDDMLREFKTKEAARAAKKESLI